MSACFVGANHVIALLRFVHFHIGNGLTLPNGWAITLDVAGRTLLLENVHALRCRYPNDDWSELEAQAKAFQYRKFQKPGDVLPPDSVWQACNCLEYQCCEDDDWPLTEAYEIVQAIRKIAGDLMAAGNETWIVHD